MSEQAYTDFLVAMGEEFSSLVSPPVPFFEAAPNECCEAVFLALGDSVTPSSLAKLSNHDIERIASAFSEWFECEVPPTSQIAEAVARTLSRWPVGSIEAV